jgi:hypothetical protein
MVVMCWCCIDVLMKSPARVEGMFLLYVCKRVYQGRTLMVMSLGNESYKNARTLWRE